jgi:hypothetical protein
MMDLEVQRLAKEYADSVVYYVTEGFEQFPCHRRWSVAELDGLDRLDGT